MLAVLLVEIHKIIGRVLADYAAFEQLHVLLFCHSDEVLLLETKQCIFEDFLLVVAENATLHYVLFLANVVVVLH